jgi:hypothetical protein
MERLGSHYAVILRDRDLRRTLTLNHDAPNRDQGASRMDRPSGRLSARRLAPATRLVAMAAAAVGLAVGSASGVEVVPVTNTLWVHNGRLADFTSTPTDSRDLERLGALWRTAAAPDRPAITDEPAPAGESIVRGNPGGCIGEPRHVHCRGRAM